MYYNTINCKGNNNGKEKNPPLSVNRFRKKCNFRDNTSEKMNELILVDYLHILKMVNVF